MEICVTNISNHFMMFELTLHLCCYWQQKYLNTVWYIQKGLTSCVPIPSRKQYLQRQTQIIKQCITHSSYALNQSNNLRNQILPKQVHVLRPLNRKTDVLNRFYFGKPIPTAYLAPTSVNNTPNKASATDKLLCYETVSYRNYVNVWPEFLNGN